MSAFLLNWVGTATLLTAAVLFLRAAFGKRISARLRYALWILVLARLLVPGQFFAAPVEASRVLSELPAALPAVSRAAAPERDEPLLEAEPAPPVQVLPAPNAGGTDSPAPAGSRPLDLPALLVRIWLAGSVLTALALLWSNLLFARRLRRVRRPLAEITNCPLPVYTAPGLPSPCLFGLFRPAVYVAPGTDPLRLRHVLVHEATHFRHGDHIWSALRCAALAVHWWNPLVWLAASLSRRDAELACDEGALKALGDDERWAYGNTLLALVTAKPKPSDLLCCATTMVGGKRSLRERVSRIARAPRRWLWAAVLAAALAVLVCACAFAKLEPAQEDRPLTAEELDHFNHEVFNGEGFNILNQFVYLAVEAPKDYRQIDLFQLFYNGTGKPAEITEEERRAVADAGYGGEDPGVDLIKCPAAEMDEILRKYLGLGLEDTDKWSLDLFTYLEEYDAYYHFCGDTNYIGNVTFTSGEYKDGNLLLYYEGSGYPLLSSDDGALIYWDGVKQCCLTLEPRKDGGFRFLSNWECDPPAHPTAYPDWDPELVIPLDGLAPYEPEPLTVERRTNDMAALLYSHVFVPGISEKDSTKVNIYRSTDGSLRAAVAGPYPEDWQDCFLTVSPEDSAGWTPEDGVEGFDLFGQLGLRISYYGWLDERYYGTFTDYYTFTDDGTPSLLLRAKGEAAAIDLDGDGETELTSDGGDTSYLFFRRDETLYQAEVHNLVRSAWPEAGYMTFGFWNQKERFMPCAVEVPMPGTDFTVTAYRDIFFDGENLRIYKDETGYTDHVKNSVDAPADVLAAARDFVQERFESLAAEGYGTDGSGSYNEGNFGPGNVSWDDWRLTGLSGPYYETAGPVRMEIWNVSYETHTATPERVMLAGGSYMGEDGWCMIGYPGCDYLYFRLDENNNRTYLYSTMENDCSPGSAVFLSDMVRALMDQGLLTLSELSGQQLLGIMDVQPPSFFNRLGDETARERDRVLEVLGAYILHFEEVPEYTACVRELSDGGVFAGELTAGGRAAWETLQGFVNWFTPDPETSAARAREMLENEGRVSEMSLPELLEYASKSDGATAEGAFYQLHQRFHEDPAAVLSALAEREDSFPLAYMLGTTIYWNEDLFPGAIEKAQALKNLSAEQDAVLNQIVFTYEAGSAA